MDNSILHSGLHERGPFSRRFLKVARHALAPFALAIVVLFPEAGTLSDSHIEAQPASSQEQQTQEQRHEPISDGLAFSERDKPEDNKQPHIPEGPEATYGRRRTDEQHGGDPLTPGKSLVSHRHAIAPHFLQPKLEGPVISREVVLRAPTTWGLQ